MKPLQRSHIQGQGLIQNMHVPRDVAEFLGEFLAPRDRARWFVACGLRTCINELRKHIVVTLARMTRVALALDREHAFTKRIELATALGCRVAYRDLYIGRVDGWASFRLKDERAGVRIECETNDCGSCDTHLVYTPTVWDPCSVEFRWEGYTRSCSGIVISSGLPLDFALVVLCVSREAAARTV